MIRSTFASFVTAQTGLNASQRALDVTGQNMSNVNVSGYTRQRLDLISLSSGGYANRYAFLPSNDVGYGVAINGVSQVRDPFLDIRFRREHAKLGEVETQYAALSDLETVFNEITVPGLSSAIADFLSQLHVMSRPENTGNVEFDSIVRTAADMMTKMFNSYAKQVTQVREQETYQLENIDVPRINTILTSITELNKTIREDQTFGNKSLELLDRRNLLLDELSQYMKIDVVYDPIEVAPGIVVEDVQIFLRTEDIPAERIPLLFNREHVTFHALTDHDEKQSYIYITEAGDPPPVLGSTADINDKIHTGVLKGLLDVLNKSGPFDDPLTDQYGIGYYEKSLDVLAAKMAEEFNGLMDPTMPLFTNIDGTTTNITASTFAVAQGWLRGEYGITTTEYDPDDWPEDISGAQDNVLRMIWMFDQPLTFTTDGTATGTQLFRGTFQEFFGQITNTLALDVSAKSNVMLTYGTTLNGVLDLREGVSTVSLDEEGINLVRYQKSYNAAARFMTTLDEALDKLINGTGIVGR